VRGSPPKPAGTRRRRNRASTARELSPAPTASGPELPAERDWHTLTARWWADVWSSPMAGEYLDADVHGLFRLAVLVDDYWRAETPTARKDLAGEIRLQGQAFGLTPLDRRRLEWTVGQVEDRGRTTSTRVHKASKDDPRLRLAQ
jgi:hypothetical protein